MAVQQFFENLGMLTATGLYAIAAGQGADPVLSLLVLGGTVMAATALLSRHSPDVDAEAESGPQ